MIREDNQRAGKSWTWTYDKAGNISSKKEYAYTTGTLGTATSTKSYSYGNSNWGDLLTAYNGSTVSSDAIGNILSDGTWTYTWEHGRELATVAYNGSTWTNTYDANGMRTARTNGSNTYSYVYNGSQLSQMTVGSNTLSFAYEAAGTPMSVTYNGTAYYYVTNLQGDITAILSSAGTAVVTYSYDAWGKLLGTDGSMENTLGVHNPLRYRGYVYDTETGLYYLQSRYYDPEVGRFINSDILMSTGQGLLGNNMYAYCNNNPVLLLDSSGTSAIVATALTIIGGGILGVVSQFIGGVVKNSIEGKSGLDLFKGTGTLGDYTSAFLSGAISAIPGVGTAVTVAFDVAVAPAIQQGVDCAAGIQDDWNTDKYLQDVLINGASCAVTMIATTPTPEYIRDIKDEAQAIGLKGTNDYNAYLSTSIINAKIANQLLAMSVSVAKEVYKGAARNMIPYAVIY